ETEHYKNGQLVCRNIYKDGDMQHKQIFEKGLVTMEYFYDKNTIETEHVIYTYHENNNVETKTFYTPQGVKFKDEFYFYSGGLHSTMLYEYNSEGWLESEKMYCGENTPNEYRWYDQNGNMIRAEIFTEAGEIGEIHKYTYENNKRKHFCQYGRVDSHREWNVSQLACESEYDKGEYTEYTTTFSPEGIIESVQYQLKENGNKVEREFNADGVMTEEVITNRGNVPLSEMKLEDGIEYKTIYDYQENGFMAKMFENNQPIGEEFTPYGTNF
ncbi:MAG: hypothetical protein IKU47_05880, partial [Oscillospiraceae bacterium]|nr:hypothetical protein [Oscillospiraceae bacterium]